MKADLKHQKDVSASYVNQSARVQEQMALDMQEKELAIEKLGLENDKYKVHVEPGGGGGVMIMLWYYLGSCDASAPGV